MKKQLQILCLISALLFGSHAVAKQYYNNMPVTMEEYFILSAEHETVKNEVVEMEKVADERSAYMPEDEYLLRKYNSPPGSQLLNLSLIKFKRQVNSVAVLSPDYQNIAYTSCYYLPDKRYISSEAFYISAQKKTPLKGKLKKANVKDRIKVPLAQSGMESFYHYTQKTLTILDWSKDSKQIAFIEKTSYMDKKPWITNLVVYDFKTQKTKRLWELREAIEYYWEHKKDITLSDYEWDIKPVGWDAVNPDRIIVTAYAYTNRLPKFLGTWSIDYRGDRAQMLSPSETKFDISINGYVLRLKI